MILVIQGQLPHYRRELFNSLCTLDEVAVVHSGRPVRSDADRFAEIVLPARKFGPFRLQEGLSKLIAELRPKTVIAMLDVRWLNSVRAMLRYDRSMNWVWWGLDRGKSYLALRAKMAIARRRNPIVFYDRVTRHALGETLAPQDKLFVANNTFHVPNRIEGHLHPQKTRFINVGSLDARKQNDVTIRALHRIVKDTETDIRFTLIGEGKERDRLVALIDALGMHNHVELAGRIEDPAVLANYYAESLASVSFGQAGLAVLQSMAFGVPFVTKRNAISGGEKHNIQDGINGVFCEDDPEDLERCLRSLIADTDKARLLGQAAFDYYSREATIDNMVTNFGKAIDYAESLRD